MKKQVALGLAAVMVVSTLLSGCGKNESGEIQTSMQAESSATEKKEENAENTVASETSRESVLQVEKPEKITIMVNGNFVTKANGQKKWVERWEELTGIELEVIQPDHDAYYDVLGQTMASGKENWPDVIMTTEGFYSNYAMEGVLWDMTDAWNQSELKNSGRIRLEQVQDSLYINDRLYGFAPEMSTGTMVYIKKAWLDRCGLEVPTTYDEYVNMLKVFTEGDPDGNGINGDTYGLSAPGFIGPEPPLTNYLAEFYQDAYPTFYKKEDGTWVDGFTEDSMWEAIERIRYIYENGYLDPETLTNGTSDCRNKYFEEKYGAFSYWAGTWASRLSDSLISNGHDGELVIMEPIPELGAWMNRVPTAYCITSACENPEGVFQYFIETMMDGGEMQTLWSYGVEGIHWSTEAETVLGKEYAEGQFHMKESLENPGALYNKGVLDPMKTVASYVDDADPGKDSFDPRAKESLDVFMAHTKPAPNPVSTEAMAQYNGDLMTLKRSIVADCITQGLSIEDAKQRFIDEQGAKWSEEIVRSLNTVRK